MRCEEELVLLLHHWLCILLGGGSMQGSHSESSLKGNLKEKVMHVTKY